MHYQLDSLSGLRSRLWWLAAIAFLLIFSLAPAASSVTASNGSPFFSIAGTLAPGETINPMAPIFTPTRDFNFLLTVGGGGPVTLTLQNSQGQPIWTGPVQAGESLWGTGILTNGQNPISLTNNGGSASNFSLSFYDLPIAPYDWAGMAAATGLVSKIRANFPADGLYTFDLGVGAGQYQLRVDDEYIQKTAVTATSVSAFVPAGTHTLTIWQDEASGANWSVGISAPGGATDTLPYTQMGESLAGSNSRFTSEWLPLALAQPTALNLELAVVGSMGETLSLDVWAPGAQAPALSLHPVFAGETVWATVDLPAGVSRIRLVADGSNLGELAYALTLDALPTPAHSWRGSANAAGLASTSRMVFPTSGLYTFTFGMQNGRYQFQVNNNFLLKTVEESGGVTYYVPAGTHTFFLNQDSDAGAGDWQVDVALTSATMDSLPYTQMGGELGGINNDFSDEWLPIALDAAQTVNLALTAVGAPVDTLRIEIFGATGSTPTFVLDNISGTETIWTTFPLAAGLNRIHLVTSGANPGPLGYDLTVTAVAANGTATWSGTSLDSGNNARIMLNFPTAGLYRFELDNQIGFANLVLDDHMLALRAPLGNSSYYDVEVSAGMHEISTIQDPAYPVTEWAASVYPVAPAGSFFNFAGTLQAGDAVAPLYTSSGPLDFNLAWTVDGGDGATLAITDADSNIVWQGTAADGETLWGTGTLADGTNTLTLANGGSEPINVDLTLYHIPDAPYEWEGTAAALGLNSEIRLTFPTSGLYTFDYGVNGGAQYQFLVNHEFIQKTVAANGAITAFVPAGTHTLLIDQDTTGGMVDWSLAVSDVGAPNDSLPYQQVGGPLDGAGFGTEWLPVNLAAATAVNVQLLVTGAAGDSLAFAANGFAVDVYAGETYWANLDLPAGTTLFNLLADSGNGGALTYEMRVAALPALPFTWEGLATAAAGPNRYSAIRVPFPVDGLYTFDFGLDNGRYQFHLADDAFQKVIESETSVTIFVPAGVHELQITQDNLLGAAWQVAIAAAAATPDSLPFAKMGGGLGSSTTQFTTDILPLYTGAATEVNLMLSVAGEMGDSLTATFLDLETGVEILTLDGVYGAETLWATLALPDSGVRISLSASGTNTAPLFYDLVVDALPQITGVNQNSARWDGITAAAGINPTMRLATPISGLYRVEVNMPLEGFIAFSIDAVLPRLPDRSPDGFSYSFDIPLTAGQHVFHGQQNAAPLTTWTLTTTLLTAAAPQITAVTPYSIPVGTATVITLVGSNFMPGAAISLVQGAVTIPLADVVIVDATMATAVVPGTVAIGDYDVMLTNPDEQSATYAPGVAIYQPTYRLYLPLAAKP